MKRYIFFLIFVPQICFSQSFIGIQNYYKKPTESDKEVSEKAVQEESQTEAEYASGTLAMSYSDEQKDDAMSVIEFYFDDLELTYMTMGGSATMRRDFPRMKKYRQKLLQLKDMHPDVWESFESKERFEEISLWVKSKS